jgi:hypothetical protein
MTNVIVAFLNFAKTPNSHSEIDRLYAFQMFSTFFTGCGLRQNYLLEKHPVTGCWCEPELSTFKTSRHRMLARGRIIHFQNIQSRNAGPSQNYPLSKHPVTGCWSEPELSTFKTSSHRMLVRARIIHFQNIQSQDAGPSQNYPLHKLTSFPYVIPNYI